AELMKEADIPVDERSPLKVGVMRCWDGMEPGYRAVALVRAEFADSFGRRVHRHLVLMETPCEPSTPRNVLRSLGVLLSD
ncbi:MAG: hypothetical protein NZ741_12475, partial [Armatimonadetes bacterium]|nr:hypothetical protein [Armatimonadota bacterium]